MKIISIILPILLIGSAAWAGGQTVTVYPAPGSGQQMRMYDVRQDPGAGFTVYDYNRGGVGVTTVEQDSRGNIDVISPTGKPSVAPGFIEQNGRVVPGFIFNQGEEDGE